MVLQAFPHVHLGDARIGAEAAETSGVKGERRAGRARESEHLTDDDQMIAALVQCVYATVEAAQGFRKLRGFGAVAPGLVELELLMSAPGEMARKIELVMR